MEGLGTVALPAQQGGQGLGIFVGHIVEGIAACTAQKGAGVDAELCIEGADAAVDRGVKMGEVDSLCHKAVDGLGILPNHPVVHGLHQHQNHIFPCQKAGHFIFLRVIFL